jgi:hypothetical protein
MLAANRKDNVAGRTEILIVSATVRKGFSQSGAPSGRRAAIKDEILFLAELIIRESQSGSPKDKVRRRCLEDGRTYGINPVQLVKIRKRNKGATIDVIPLIDLPTVRDIWSFIRDMGRESV